MAKIGIVTPCFEPNPSWFERCKKSALSQPHCVHYIVWDGQVPTTSSVLSDSIREFSIPGPHGDAGNAARAVGSILAAAEGVDWIAFLDADNWYEPDHIARMLDCSRQSGAWITSCTRNLYALDGSLMGVCPQIDGERFVDTSCLLIARQAFALLSTWASIPPANRFVGDQVFWAEVIRSGYSRAHINFPSVAYRTAYAVHYEHFGITKPEGVKKLLYGSEGYSLEYD